MDLSIARAVILSLVALISYAFGRRAHLKQNQYALKSNPVEAFPEQCASILNAICEPIIILNNRSVVIFANHAAQLSLPNVKHNNPFSFGLRDPTVLEAVDSVLKLGQTITVNYHERTPIERFYELNIALVNTDKSIILMRDVTKLQRIETMRVDFVANASHELRTPLASIIGFIETLQGSAKADPVARTKFLNIMGEQARRMSRLVDDLLALSRIELSQHVAPNTPVNVEAVVRLIADTLSGLARSRGVEIVVHVPDNKEFTILGDRDEMLRVFENLIENAIKYGQSGKKVDVTLAKNQETIDISVRDYGPGIASEHLPRLTERFYRADIGTSREQGGTGLGLAIVKHIITRHHGELKINSKLGQGAEFCVSLPLYN